jgi:hypothetical protein
MGKSIPVTAAAGERPARGVGQIGHPAADDARHGVGDVVTLDHPGGGVEASAVVQQPDQFADVERVSPGAGPHRRREFRSRLDSRQFSDQCGGRFGVDAA